MHFLTAVMDRTRKAAWGVLAGVAPLAAQDVDFQTQVRPILEGACFACHGALKQKADLRLDHNRELAARVQPGDHAASELWMRLVSEDEDQRMPQKAEPLPAEQIALVALWIDQGAVLPAGGDPLPLPLHWAYQPLRAPVLGASTRHPIDLLVEGKLAERGLLPNPLADRRTLLRRLSLDVRGLPPTPEELAEFLAEQGPFAWEHAVDRLLASPQRAERMAQWWLDLARYADTNGYEKDDRRTPWRWRDWVIESFAANMPFDRFTVEQLAGDLLPEADQHTRLATGFHRNTMLNQEGGADPEEFRVAAVVDRTNTTASVWLGSTMACAQCHNHKFDPISQREYFEFLAFFDQTQDDGYSPAPVLPAPTAAMELSLQTARLAVAEAKTRLEADDPRFGADELAFAAQLRASGAALPEWRSLPLFAAVSRAGPPLEIESDGSLFAPGARAASESFVLDFAPASGLVAALSIEALKDERLPGQGPGASASGNFVLTRAVLERVRAETSAPVVLRAAAADYEQHGGGHFPARAAIDEQANSGWAVGRPAGNTLGQRLVLVPEQAFELQAGEHLRLVLECQSDFAQHVLARARFALTADEDFALRACGPDSTPWSQYEPLPVASGADGHARPLAAELGLLRPASTLESLAVERAEWVDGRALELPGEHKVHVLVRRLDSALPQRVRFGLSADDTLRLYCNERVVFESDQYHVLDGPADFVDVDLPAGETRLVLELVNGGGPGGFYFEAQALPFMGLPSAVFEAALLEPSLRSPEQQQVLSEHVKRCVSPLGRELYAQYDQAQRALQAQEALVPLAMVMAEVPEPRVTHLLRKGSFLDPGEVVQAGTPAILPSMEPGWPRNRLGLAQWLVSGSNPLVPRVIANRVWDLIFGRGLVATLDDFGTRGDSPTHPELLDWLALHLVESGWDLRELQRTIFTSETWMRSAQVTAEGLEKDPRNEWLARAPRLRLEVETLRDTQLAMAGLLVEEVGGPSVMPPQPEGVWAPVYSSDSWSTAAGADRWRRGLYTFWKRSSPYASFMLFDAPSRELVCTRRPRTNTPLQALTLLNDPAFVECAAGLALRVLRERSGEHERLQHAFEITTGRLPLEREEQLLFELLASERARLAAEPRLVGERLSNFGQVLGGEPAPEPAELAAWFALGSVLLNLDETITRG